MHIFSIFLNGVILGSLIEGILLTKNTESFLAIKVYKNQM